MTSIIDVRDAINAALIAHAGWGARPVYLGSVPKDFLRPSFLLEVPSYSMFNGNSGIVQVTAYFTVTVFLPVDDYSMADTDTLLTAQTQLMDVFRSGVLTVGARRLKLSASTGGLDYDRGVAYVDLTISYSDVRSDAGTQQPVMSALQAKITRKD